MAAHETNDARSVVTVTGDDAGMREWASSSSLGLVLKVSSSLAMMGC